MRVLPMLGWANTLFMAKKSRLPMKLESQQNCNAGGMHEKFTHELALYEKASEKPQKYHWKDATAIPASERNIIERAFLRRRRPA